MESREMKIRCSYNSAIALKVYYGHFATNHSHINYYIDMTTLKVRQKESYNIAKNMAREYVASTIIDTIVCMDGTEIIGAYLAEELSAAGIISMNAHKSIYIVTPEFNSNGQLIFRDNIKPMIKNKHILLLIASATTGKTIAKSVECIEYYSGRIEGVSSIFSAVNNIHGRDIHAIFTTEDLPSYATYSPSDCPLCKAGKKLDAIVNSFGYLKLEQV